MHTLVTHVRRQTERLTIDGVRVTWAAAAPVAEGGNTTGHCGVLSDADTVSVTAIVDPDHFPELDELDAAVADSLSSIMGRCPSPSSLAHRGRRGARGGHTPAGQDAQAARCDLLGRCISLRLIA